MEWQQEPFKIPRHGNGMAAEEGKNKDIGLISRQCNL